MHQKGIIFIKNKIVFFNHSTNPHDPDIVQNVLDCSSIKYIKWISYHTGLSLTPHIETSKKIHRTKVNANFDKELKSFVILIENRI